MPLTRAIDNYLSGDDIRFLMQDGEFEFPCCVSLQALSVLGHSVGLRDPVEVFVTYREEIERAASSKYDGTERRAYEIVTLTKDDLSARPAIVG